MTSEKLKAIVTTAFPGCKDGTQAVRRFQVGEIIEGDLARAAIEGRLAEEKTDRKARKTKRQDRGRAPQNQARPGN